MTEYKVFCDKCGKEITENKGRLHFHYHSYGAGSMGGDEDEHDCDYQDLCPACTGELASALKKLGYKFKYQYGKW